MSDLTAFGIQELINQGKRLGLFPTYRYGTVQATSGSNSAILLVILDGDDEISRVYNNVGPLGVGDRVFTVFVPPHGIYAIGQVATNIVPSIRLSSSAAQSLPNNVSTALTFNTIHHSNVPDWFTAGGSAITIMRSGRYLLSGGGSTATNATGVRTIQLQRNGADEFTTGVLEFAAAGASVRMASRTEIIEFQEGETAGISIFQNSGGALNTAVVGTERPSFNLLYIGPLID